MSAPSEPSTPAAPISNTGSSIGPSTGPGSGEAAPERDPSLPGTNVWPRGPDRRRRPTPRLSRYTLFGGRRKTIRRQEEREGSFVDQYSTRMWLLLAWIGLMNVGDSFFTLLHLQTGGIELNPFAALLLESGRTGFVVFKSLLIGLPLLVLCLHKNFQLARLGLWIAAGSYTVLFLYHLWLL
jgi:uncharacterized protein DUF5658